MENQARLSWDAYFMALAKIAASRSTCLSRPTGCVIVKDKQVITSGYNGSMPGVTHCLDEGFCYRRSVRTQDAGKYDFCRSVHAEANAIALAGKRGLSLLGGTIYVTLHPCYVCTKLLVSAGLKEVVYETGYSSEDTKRDQHWKEALKDSGLKVRKFQLKNEEIQRLLPFLTEKTSSRRIEKD